MNIGLFWRVNNYRYITHLLTFISFTVSKHSASSLAVCTSENVFCNLSCIILVHIALCVKLSLHRLSFLCLICLCCAQTLKLFIYRTVLLADMHYFPICLLHFLFNEVSGISQQWYWCQIVVVPVQNWQKYDPQRLKTPLITIF